MNASEVQILDPQVLSRKAQEAAERLKRANQQQYNAYSSMKRDVKGKRKDLKALVGDVKGKGIEKIIEKLNKIKAEKKFDRKKLLTSGWSLKGVFQDLFKSKKNEILQERKKAAPGIKRNI